MPDAVLGVDETYGCQADPPPSRALGLEKHEWVDEGASEQTKTRVNRQIDSEQTGHSPQQCPRDRGLLTSGSRRGHSSAPCQCRRPPFPPPPRLFWCLAAPLFSQLLPFLLGPQRPRIKCDLTVLPIAAIVS